LPPVFLGLYTRWFHRYAMIVGWIGGMVSGTWLAAANAYASVTPVTFFGTKVALMPALVALVVNLVLCVVLTLVFQALKVAQGQDATSEADYAEVEAAGIPAAGD
jgi:SSS family solute:Na+ symporter